MNNYIVLYQSDANQNDVSVQNWKSYCDKHNIKMIYLSDLIQPRWNRINQIFYVFEIFEVNQIDYDSICLVSDSTLIRSNTPNVFELTDNKLTFAEWDSDFGYLLTNIELYQKHIFNNQNVDFTRFFDLSFFIVNKTHKSIFENILNFFYNNYTELYNKLDTDFIPQNFFFDCEYKKLPYTYNMIDIPRKEVLDIHRLIKLGYIYNFNGLTNKQDLMKSTSKLL